MAGSRDAGTSGAGAVTLRSALQQMNAQRLHTVFQSLSEDTSLPRQDSIVGGSCHKYNFYVYYVYIMFAATEHLSRQNHACRDKIFLSRQTRVCRDRHMFVATDTCLSRQNVCQIWNSPRF